MIPILGVISVRKWDRSRSFRLWIPLLLIWLLLLPIAILLVPIFVLVCLISRVNPFRALATLWQIVSAMRDTHIEINNPDTLLLVRIL